MTTSKSPKKKSVGRPVDPTLPRVRKDLRAHQPEWDRWERAAKANGVSLNSYIRAALNAAAKQDLAAAKHQPELLRSGVEGRQLALGKVS